MYLPRLVAFVRARYDTANRTAGGDVQLSGALAKIGLCRAVYRSKTLCDKTAANRGYETQERRLFLQER